ncbi:hypothetical protein [Streptomyces poonensis]|uniref:Uncharacterized protein n=1 Tax=Streptomyces poonensis TaxID=68255 RepID=A0A918UQG2_9ACTN|nr:hypothetical protein [Streptomyces poonensis]GGZ26603.1 hypothetical protein GCM10010365_53760 [Streptomyces poonensis]GLJ93569.1 hypothetical protein GCM10017589_61840 [Streptomyces poonensis]
MESEVAPGAWGTTCPGCGGSAVRTVPDTCADQESVRSRLSDRLARQPGVTSRFDTFTHTVEGLLLTAVGGALAYEGIQKDKQLYTIGGSVLAVLLFLGTIYVIFDEIRERRVVAAGESRADALWRSASCCSGCGAVFFPAGSPWPHPLTPEQFQKYVWTEAGYGKRLDKRVRDVALPPAHPSRPGGVSDHA